VGFGGPSWGCREGPCMCCWGWGGLHVVVRVLPSSRGAHVGLVVVPVLVGVVLLLVLAGGRVIGGPGMVHVRRTAVQLGTPRLLRALRELLGWGPHVLLRVIVVHRGVRARVRLVVLLLLLLLLVVQLLGRGRAHHTPMLLLLLLLLLLGGGPISPWLGGGAP